MDHSRYASFRGNHELDGIVERLASMYNVPLAALSIIDRERQVLVSRRGIDVDHTPRDEAFCAVAIHRPGETLLVGDARKDDRFKQLSAVKGVPHVRFYAGKPVLSRDGYALGALCVADMVPRSTKGFDATGLTMLASQIERIMWR